MSQSRFSIVLVGVSALLRRPLVSRLRPAGFTARGSGGFRRSALPSVSALPSPGWSSGSRLPLFGMRRFGVALGELAFGLTASAFRHAPLRGCPRRVGSSAGRVGLRVYGFRFSARTASGLPLGELTFGLTASAFRHAPLRSCPRRVGSSAFRFGVCRSASWPSGSLLLLFGTHRFGVALGGLALPPSVSEIAARRVGASAFRFGDCCSAGWPSGSPLSLFGTHRSASPHRRSEGRRSTPTRHLFHFKTLIPTC